MKNAKYVITCDMCSQVIELDSIQYQYNDKFLDVVVDGIHFDICKKCAKQNLTFLPGVMV